LTTTILLNELRNSQIIKKNPTDENLLIMQIGKEKRIFELKFSKKNVCSLIYILDRKIENEFSTIVLQLQLHI
jgi:hypothetical protein